MHDQLILIIVILNPGNDGLRGKRKTVLELHRIT